MSARIDSSRDSATRCWDARGAETCADRPNLLQRAHVEDQKVFVGTAAGCDRTRRKLELAATGQREKDAVVSVMVFEAAT
jgi:hypothetical protein